MNRINLRLDGIALAPGIAIGKVLPLHSNARNQVPEKRIVEDVAGELEKFSAALKETEIQLASLRDELKNRLHEKEAGIFDAHLMLCSDRAILNDVKNLISNDSCCAEYAVYVVSEITLDHINELDELMRMLSLVVTRYAYLLFNGYTASVANVEFSHGTASLLHCDLIIADCESHYNIKIKKCIKKVHRVQFEN